MILMLVTLSKPIEMGPELEEIGKDVSDLAQKYGLKIDVDFEKLEDE